MFLSYSRDQGLIEDAMLVETLFVASTFAPDDPSPASNMKAPEIRLDFSRSKFEAFE